MVKDLYQSLTGFAYGEDMFGRLGGGSGGRWTGLVGPVP